MRFGDFCFWGQTCRITPEKMIQGRINILKKIRFGVGVLCFLLLAAGSLRAEKTEDSGENPMYLNEVVVTSTRTENRIMETPSNISVIV